MLPSIANGFPDPYNGLRLAALLLLAETRERPGERTVWPLVDTRGLTAFGSHVLHAARLILDPSIRVRLKPDLRAWPTALTAVD